MSLINNTLDKILHHCYENTNWMKIDDETYKKMGNIIAEVILESQKDTYIAIEAERYLYSSEQ